MDIQAILSVANELVFAKTGKHLDNLQVAILKGTLTRQKYTEIANNNNVTRGHIKDVVSNLWKILSEELGENINKSNVVATIERVTNSNVSYVGKDIIHIGDVHFCNNNSIPSQLHQPLNSPHLDLDDAPTLHQFYGRETELEILKTAILNQNIRLITLAGLSGIGKTTLILKLIEMIQDQFNYVIYRNLQDFASLDELLEDVISIFLDDDKKEHRAKAQQRMLMKYFRQYKCLLILDNGQVLLKEGELAGTYSPNYQNFTPFFQQIGQSTHQSCLILNSWEPPKDIQTLADNTTQVKIMYLKGLEEAAKAILSDKNLKDEEIWNELIQQYEGHPQGLKWVATMISDLWEGKIRQAWQYQTLLLPDELKTSLETQIQRLTILERQILTHLSGIPKPLTLTQLFSHFNQSSTDIGNAIQSLKKRAFIESNGDLEVNLLLKAYLHWQQDSPKISSND